MSIEDEQEVQSFEDFYDNLKDAIIIFSSVGRGQNRLTSDDANLFIRQNAKWMTRALQRFCKQSKTVKSRESLRLGLNTLPRLSSDDHPTKRRKKEETDTIPHEAHLKQQKVNQPHQKVPTDKREKKKQSDQKNWERPRLINQEEIYNLYKQQSQTRPLCANTITRHEQSTCHALDRFDRTQPLNQTPVQFTSNLNFMKCYVCGLVTRSPHPVYIFCCNACGEYSQRQRRRLERHGNMLKGRNALVTGARTKLGHQVVLQLLRSGCDKVVCTTRYPEKAKEKFLRYHDCCSWFEEGNERLKIVKLDLDVSDLIESDCMVELVKVCSDFLRRQSKSNSRDDNGDNDGANDETSSGASLDILVNCAAQTIRARDKPNVDIPTTTARLDNKGDSNNNNSNRRNDASSLNRYGDPRFVSTHQPNSWNIRLPKLDQTEMEEVYRVNAIAPTLLIQAMLPFLQSSKSSPQVINVHSREGLFNVGKNDIHLHTNMSKAALAMMTRCLAGSNYKTYNGKKFEFHGCDPGWFSIDEYYEQRRPWMVPPLDEVDAAARVLYPLADGDCATKDDPLATPRQGEMFSDGSTTFGVELTSHTKFSDKPSCKCPCHNKGWNGRREFEQLDLDNFIASGYESTRVTGDKSGLTRRHFTMISS